MGWACFVLLELMYLCDSYFWFGPQDYSDKDLSWKLRITPQSATRVYVQYYTPNVNYDNDALKFYSGAAR